MYRGLGCRLVIYETICKNQPDQSQLKESKFKAFERTNAGRTVSSRS
jgi:hypothetical protein